MCVLNASGPYHYGTNLGMFILTHFVASRFKGFHWVWIDSEWTDQCFASLRFAYYYIHIVAVTHEDTALPSKIIIL